MIRSTFDPHLVVVIACALCGMPWRTAQAMAPEEPAPAEVGDELRESAVSAFAEGDYESAIEAFEAAYARSPEPTDLYNLGRIHEEIGNLEEALAQYERFVGQPHVKLEERRKAAERIEVLRMVVKQPPPPVEPAPAPAPAPASEPVGGPVDEPRAAGRPLVITGSVLLGLGAAVAAGGGVVFGVRGRRAREDIDGFAQGMNPERMTLSQAEERDVQGRNADILQMTFIVAGGVTAIVGTTLLTVGLVRHKRASRPTMGASLSPQHATVSATWSF